MLQDQINDGVMDLAVDSRREQFLQAQMIEDLDAIEHHRQSRLLLGMHRLPALFWYTAFIGFLIVGAMSFVFAPTVPHMVIVCGYGLYTGLVMYVILAFNYPITGPAAVDPSAFQLLGGEARRDLAQNGWRAGSPARCDAVADQFFRTPDVLAMWVAIASIRGGDRQS